MNRLKKGEKVSLLIFEEGPGVLLLKFEGVPGPRSQGPWSRSPGHTLTPCPNNAA